MRYNDYAYLGLHTFLHVREEEKHRASSPFPLYMYICKY